MLFLFLAVVGVGAVLAAIVLLNEKRIHCKVRIYRQCHECHLGALFHHLCVTTSWNTRLMACSHNLSAAVQKSFLKDDALTLRLEAKDILGMTQQETRVDYDCSLLHQFMRHDNRRICLSLRYSL